MVRVSQPTADIRRSVMRREEKHAALAWLQRVVREDEIVPVADLEVRLGLGPSAIRTARRQGLKVRRIGRRKFVLGRDLIAFLESRS
jgi:hypothetical protein